MPSRKNQHRCTADHCHIANDWLYYYYYFMPTQQTAKQTHRRWVEDGLQRTSWQRRFFVKKPRLLWSVTEQLLKQTRRLFWIASDGGGALSNLLDQFDRLVVPDTRGFKGHRIKHTLVLVNWSYLVVLLWAAILAAAPACLIELATCASVYVLEMGIEPNPNRTHRTRTPF